MLDYIDELFIIYNDDITRIAKAKYWDTDKVDVKDKTDKRRNKLHNRGKEFEYNGEKHTLVEWSKILGIGVTTLHARLYKLNWPIDKVFMPKRSEKEDSDD